MVKNQILGKLVQWVERRQQTPLNNHGKQDRLTSEKQNTRNVNTAWGDVQEYAPATDSVDHGDLL